MKFRSKVEVYNDTEKQFWACLFSEKSEHIARRRIVQDWLERGFWVRKLILEENKVAS